MRACAFVAGILFLLAVPFAANYTAEYTAGSWLHVTRTIQVMENPCFSGAVSNVCMNSGAVFPAGSMSGYYTRVSLTVQNTGTLLREGISVGEDMAYVPAGVNITFFPKPASNDGRQVFWGIGGLGAGESKSVAYEFPAAFREGAMGRISPVSVVSEPVLVSLLVPSSSKVGDSLAITLKTSSGQPVGGATVYVGYPDGTSRQVTTGKDGVAKFTASRTGYYTYSVDGYKLSAPVSTETRASEPSVPPVAAAAVGTGLLPSIAGVFPVLAAIFAVAVIALIIYNFASRKGGEEEAPVAPQAYQPQAQAPVYTQKFTFGQGESQQESRIRETTRDVLESRKRQLQGSAQERQEQREDAAGQGIWKNGGGQQASGAESLPEEGREGLGQQEEEKQPGFPEEADKTFMELDRQVAELEAQARTEGESTREEEDIEKTIAELEAIREKLRSRNLIGSGEKEAGSDAGEAEPEEKVKKPKYPSPQKARPQPRPRKMRYASHGTRRK